MLIDPSKVFLALAIAVLAFPFLKVIGCSRNVFACNASSILRTAFFSLIFIFDNLIAFRANRWLVAAQIKIG